MQRFSAAVLVIAGFATSQALAGTNGAFLVPVSAPTLDEVGLGLMIVLLGVVGGLIARRKK
jgi:hypothetical protein